MSQTLPRRLMAAIFIAVLALLSACSSPPTSPPPPVTPPTGAHELTKTDIDAWLDGKLTDALDNGDFPGAMVVVVKDGEILTSRGYGHATIGTDASTQVPVDPETTVFRWGSISKIPTSIAAMQLVEQGKLDLDTDIATYTDVPVKKHHSEPITLRHLLTHTAGFEGSLNTGSPDLQHMPLADYVRYNPPVSVYRPGTTPGYSNYGIALAGYLVEKASGQPFQDYLREHVLAPAGMTTATFEQPLPDGMTSQLADGYSLDGDPVPFDAMPDSPAGALSGSGADAAAFMLAQLNRSPHLLSAQGWEQMWTPALTEDTLGNLANSPRTGLGYFTGTRNGHRFVAHSGDLTGYHSEFEIYPDSRVGIFLSVNGDGNASAGLGTHLRADLTEGFADRYFPTDRVETPHLEGSAERAHQVAGVYFSSQSVHTTWFSAWSTLVSSSTIQVLDNGNLLYRDKRDTADKEYVEVAPWIWKDPHTDATLTARVVDGKVEAVGVGPGQASALLPVTPTQQALLPVFIASLAALALVLGAWLIGAITRLVQNRRGQSVPGLPWPARIARLGAVSAATALTGWCSVFMAVMGSNFDLLENTLLRTIQVLQWAGIAAIIPAALDFITTIKTRAGWKRTTMAALLLAALLATCWWAITGNAINPNLGL